MAKIDIVINNIKYSIVCSEGHEAYVESLAQLFSARVEEVNKDLKSADNARLFLIVSLLFVDEVQSLKKQVSEMGGGSFSLAADGGSYEARLEAILERVKKISDMTRAE